VNRKVLPGVSLLLASVIALGNVEAQSNNYVQTNLVSRVPGLALNFDDDLQHPWGLAASANQAFRIAANAKGQFRSYDAGGIPQDPRAVIAIPPGVQTLANPTGVAANTTVYFVPRASPLPSPFLFATRQGTISGEYNDGRGDIQTTTLLVVDHGSQGAEYTGLAILTPDCCAPYLAAADFHRGYIETFTALFDPLGIVGAFEDSNLPAGYAPWNVQVVGDHVFVAYALQDAAQHNPVAGAGNGIVDIYNLDGSFVRRFASNGQLNVPSGIVQAGANFGAFSNDILIGNYGDGLINAFDPSTGQFMGTLKDGNGNPIANLNLHSMVFGDGNPGHVDTLYLTAGLGGGADGVFAAIGVNASGAGPDFVLSPDRPSVTVAPGQPGTFSIKAAPAGNFRGAFSFACNAPAGVSCTVSSPTVDPVTGSATVGVTATASAGTSNMMAVFVLPGLLFAGIGFRKRRALSAFVILAIGLLVLTVSGISACGSSGGSRMNPGPTTQSFSVTATADAISHSTTLTLNVQ
jgi:uncharacterized protein (TIGR03118 family)